MPRCLASCRALSLRPPALGALCAGGQRCGCRLDWSKGLRPLFAAATLLYDRPPYTIIARRGRPFRRVFLGLPSGAINHAVSRIAGQSHFPPSRRFTANSAWPEFARSIETSLCTFVLPFHLSSSCPGGVTFLPTRGPRCRGARSFYSPRLDMVSSRGAITWSVECPPRIRLCHRVIIGVVKAKIFPPVCANVTMYRDSGDFVARKAVAAYGRFSGCVAACGVQEFIVRCHLRSSSSSLVTS